MDGKYGIFSLDGHLALSLNGDITQSELIFSSDDLSSISPLQGQLHGKGSLGGSLFSPKLDLSLESDSLRVADNTLKNVKITLSPHQEDEKLMGHVALSFVMKGEKHHFSAAVSLSSTISSISRSSYI